MTPFHVGASNQSCGILTSQLGPGRVTQHYRCTSRPPSEAPYCGNSDNSTGVFSPGIRGILLIKLMGHAQLPSFLNVQLSRLFVLVYAAKPVTDQASKCLLRAHFVVRFKLFFPLLAVFNSCFSG